MTMSASARALSNWPRSTAWAPNSAASACARLRVRLAITMRFTPAVAKCRAVSAIMSPAPINRMVWALKFEYMRRVSLTVADASETAFAPIWVSERTRLARRESGLKELIEGRPVLPVSCATRVSVFQLPQDLRLPQHHRVQARGDAEGMFDGTLFLVNVDAGGQDPDCCRGAARASATAQRRWRSPPNRLRYGCRWTGSRPRQCRFPGAAYASAATSRSSLKATFSRSETGAVGD